MEIELYDPSNSDCAEAFMSSHCYLCARMPVSSDAGGQCKIMGRALAFHAGDPEYPNEWRYVDDSPTCTAFKSREEFNAERRAKRRPKLIAVSSDDLFAESGSEG